MVILEMIDFIKLQCKERLEQLFEEFSLMYVWKNLGNCLLGGEKCCMEIVCVLVINLKFVLFDEFFVGVDLIVVEDIQSIVVDLWKKNIGIFIIDYNVQEILFIMDCVYLLFEGSILCFGIVEELVEDEMVRKVYLGQNFVLCKNN